MRRESGRFRRSTLSPTSRTTSPFFNHVAFTKYAGKWIGNFVLSGMCDITEDIDAILADQLSYTDLLPALERTHYCAYRPTGDRPGTLRYDPATTAAAPGR